MLTLKQAGSLLGVSYATVRRLIEQGVLPAINTTPYGRKTYRIRQDDLKSFMLQNGCNNFTPE
jgi:excisionase family DNA binding protein